MTRQQSFAGFLASGLATLFLTQCGNKSAQSPASAHVVAATPTLTNADGPSRLTVTFDQPMVAESAVGKPASEGEVTMVPNTPFSTRWHDRHTLVIETQTKLDANVNYVVKLEGELKRQVGNYQYDLSTRPLELHHVAINADMASRKPSLPLVFSTAVEEKAVAAHCHLVPIGAREDSNDTRGRQYKVAADVLARYRANNEKIALQPGPEPSVPAPKVDADTPHVVLMHPSAELALARSYALICANLPAKSGVRLAEDAVFTFATHPAFAAEVTAPAAAQTVRANDLRIELAFATPVTAQAVKAALTSKPALKGLGDGWTSWDGRRYTVEVEAAAFTDYELQLQGLVDDFGQKQSQSVAHRFRTSDAHPALSLAAGLQIWEKAQGALPFWTRNVASVNVSCAAVPSAALAKTLRANIDYYPRWEDKKPALDWAGLGLTPKVTTLTVPREAVKWLPQPLDLAKLCGSATTGVYLLEAHSTDIKREGKDWDEPVDRARSLVAVTNLGVVVKHGPVDGVVWVTSLQTGAPLAGANVQVIDNKDHVVASGVSDAQGLVRIALPTPSPKAPTAAEAETEYVPPPSYYVTVQKDADMTVVETTWNDGLYAWAFGVPSSYGDQAPRARGFLQTDRGLYRPGDTAHIKGLIRNIAGQRAPTLPARSEVRVVVQNSRGEEVLAVNRPLSAFGGFHADVALPTGAPTGDYRIVASSAGSTFSESFAVEEYRTATFTTGLDLMERGAPLLRGQPLAARVTAAYLFGAPVTQGDVKWTLARTAYSPRFAGFDEYSFATRATPWWSENQNHYFSEIADGKGALDATGTLALQLTDPNLKDAGEGSLNYELHAEVTDAANQTMAARKVITAHAQDLYVGLKTDDYVQTAGKAFALDLVAVSTDGTRVATNGTLRWDRVDYECSYAGLYGLDNVSCDQRSTTSGQQAVSIAATGQARTTLTIAKGGEYQLIFTGKDRSGRKVTASMYAWVSGSGASWRQSDDPSMRLIAGKPLYHPGETAQLVPDTALPNASTLLTVERAGILTAKVISTTASQPLTAIDVPVDESWAPNVFVSATMVSGRQGAGDRHRPRMKMGVATINVDAKHRTLDVQVTLDAKQHRPGEKVTGKITVRANGKPVAAELAVAVADEGVLKLIDYQTPNPLKAFYAPWLYTTQNAANLNRMLRALDPNRKRGDEGGDAGTNDGQRVRSKFLATAYWNPALVTDANGEASFSFDTPDNLTTFRVMAAAADQGAMFGAGEASLLVTKPLVLSPALARFFRSNDQASLGLVVANRTDKAGTYTVTVAAQGVTVAQPRTQVAVPARGTARVDFAATVAATGGTAQLTFTATGNDATDTVAVEVPIERYRNVETQELARTEVTAQAPLERTINIGAGTLLDESEVVLTLDRTGLGDLEPSLRALIQYPYGCLEQTMSKMVPLVAARDLSLALGGSALQGAQAQRFVDIAVAKLANHQHEDGMFSLWPDSEALPHLTAYAVWALHQAERSGVQLPKQVVQRGLDALTAWANQQATLTPDGNTAALSLAVYVAAERKKPMRAIATRLYTQRATLPIWARAFLWRAFAKSGAPARQLEELRASVVNSIASTPNSAFVEDVAMNDPSHMGSRVRATAMVLDALVALAPQDPLVAKLAHGLLAHRDQAGAWETTQDNVWSLVALANYAKVLGAAPANATVTLDGKPVGLPKAKSAAAVSSLALPAAHVNGKSLKITSPQAVNAVLRLRAVQPGTPNAQANGFVVARRYLNRAGTPVTQAKAGELLTVEVTVSARADAPFAAIVDPLPMGLEPVNPRLGPTTARRDDRNDEESFDDEGETDGDNWWVTYAELRDDRAQWFVNHMYKGEQTLTYQVRATTPGRFFVPPAMAEQMYAPTVNGRSAALTFTVTGR